jgi:HK97 family phage portal protein
VSLLARATARPIKAMDQEAMASQVPNHYIPIESLQRWTGLGISEQTALNYIAVYQCVRVLSNTFAMLPLKLYRQREDGGKDAARDHPVYRMLHLAPNPDMSSFVWRKIAMRHIATWGNHYSEKVLDGLGRLQLWPIRPDRIEPSWGKDGRRKYTYLSSLGGRKEMRPGSVFHMQGQTTDGLLGYSPITDLRNTLHLAQSADRYARSVFDNGARPAVVLSHPKTLSAGAIERLGAQMDDLRGAGNAGKTVVLEEGLGVTPVGFPPEDSLFLSAQLNQHRLIYGAYGIPPHKVGDLERATFSNIEHQSLEFIQDGILPWLVNAEQEFAMQIIEDDGYWAEFDTDGYLRGDSKTRAEALAIRWQHGTLTANQWRKLENENPVDGGDQYYVPVNYQPVVDPADRDLGTADETAEGEPSAPSSPPQLVAVKSAVAVEMRCPSCKKLMLKAAMPGSSGECPRCKVEVAV